MGKLRPTSESRPQSGRHWQSWYQHLRLLICLQFLAAKASRAEWWQCWVDVSQVVLCDPQGGDGQTHLSIRKQAFEGKGTHPESLSHMTQN
jgi:hypothetical protein